MRGGAQLVAVLGPTNTGKTHLAVERMCAHAGGMIGLPLRLLAREVYERVVTLKGAPQVALVTGEERIVPEGARYFLCTTESMVRDRAFPFVAIDEAQMAADPERGHVFTNAVLHLRGTAETMILGADTLRPLLRHLLPDAEIVGRQRFSKLTWSEPRKLSRLPPRSAIVAFTAEEVYAIAEMLRRLKGGAAVVMGGLSPRTRNAQVALYQSGEVDYLVATDAIGMGLNMDIAHVAFASLSKFDGRRQRRLFAAEMAQIAGRAGRHQRDGSFGCVQPGLDDGAAPAFTDAERCAIEDHEFRPLRHVVWRNGRPDFSSLPRLIGSLDSLPSAPELWRSEDAVDLKVLKILGGEDWVRARATSRPLLQRLWEVCGLPDYRKSGAAQHARLVGRMFRHLSEQNGLLPTEWIRAELAVLDNVAGDIATLAERIAAARTWTYVAHRAGWLPDAPRWTERARAVEDRLSDALHQGLTQRFVDRRTSLLLRGLRVRDSDLVAEIDPDGAVVVGGVILGLLSGFAFRVDPAARAGEKRLLLAAAERRLRDELSRRAAALATAADRQFELRLDAGRAPALLWNGARVAVLVRGRDMLHPRLALDRALLVLDDAARQQVRQRLSRWLEGETARLLGPLQRLQALQGELTPPARGLAVQLVETLGVLPRASVADLLADLAATDRQALRRNGVRLGVVHVFVPELLRPVPTRLRLALWALGMEIPTLSVPPAGSVSLRPDGAALPGFYAVAGYWLLDGLAVRVDVADRAARILHDQRRQRRADDHGAIRPGQQILGSLGLGTADLARLLRALGFRGNVDRGFRYRPQRARRRPGAAQAAPTGPFAVLGNLLAGAEDG